MMKPPVTSITEMPRRKHVKFLSVENFNKREHPGSGEAYLSSNDNRKILKAISVSHKGSNITGFVNKTVDKSLTEIPSIIHCRRPSATSDFLERQNILRKVCAMKVNNFFTSSSRQEDYAAVLLKKKCFSNTITNILPNGHCNNDGSETSLTDDVSLLGNNANKFESIVKLSADIAVNSVDNSEENRTFLENFMRYSNPSQRLLTCREYLHLLWQLFKQYRESGYEICILVRRKLNFVFELCWFEIKHKVGWIFLFVFGGIRNARDELGKSCFRFFAIVYSLWEIIANAFQSVLSMIRSWISFAIEFIQRFITLLFVRLRGVFRVIAVPTKSVNKYAREYNESQPPAIETEISNSTSNNVPECTETQLPAVVSPAESIPDLQRSHAMNASMSDSESDSESIVQNALSMSRAWENSFAYEKIYPDIAEEFNAALSPDHHEEFNISSPILVEKSRSEETVSYDLVYGGKGEDYIPTHLNASSTSSPEFVGFDESKRGVDDIHLSQIYPSGDAVCTPSLVLTSQFAIDDRFPHLASHGIERDMSDNFRRGNLDFENVGNNYFYDSYRQEYRSTTEQLVCGTANVFKLSSFQSPGPNEKSVSVNESTSDDSAFMEAAVSSEERRSSSHTKDSRVNILESPFVDITEVYLAGSYDDSVEHEFIIPDLCRTLLASNTGSGYSLYH